MKKILSAILAIAMLTTCAFAADFSAFSDIPSNWAKGPIERAIVNGLLNGSNGKINPDGLLTRAELCAIITRATNAQIVAENLFSDIDSDDWYYESIGKAAAMHTFNGSNGLARPNDPITREEAMAIISRLLQLNVVHLDSVPILAEFPDNENVADWAKDDVAALINSGYVNGANGKINPKSNITRAEFSAIMDRIVSVYIDGDDVSIPEEAKNVMLKTIEGNITLSNVTIDGDLIIADGLGDGKVVLNNVTIKGRLLVRGGNDAVEINNGSKVEGGVIASKITGRLRISISDDSDISHTYVAEADDLVIDGHTPDVIIDSHTSQIRIEKSDTKELVIHDDHNHITISKCASLDNAHIVADTVGNKIIFENDSRANKVTIDGSDATVSVSGDSSVGSVDINGDNNTVNGEGNVDKVVVNDNNKDNTTVDTEGTKIEVTPSPDQPDQPDQPSQPVKPNGPSQGGNQGGGTVVTKDKINSLTIYGDKNSVPDSILANATYTPGKWVIDLSGCSLLDVIRYGEATSDYGNDIDVGDAGYLVPTNTRVTFNQLLGILNSASTRQSISVGAFKNILSDINSLRTSFENQLGITLPTDYSNYISFGTNTFTIYTTFDSESVLFEIIFPA